MLCRLRRARPDQYEMSHMLGVAERIGHRDDAAPAVPQQVDAVELQLSTERFQIADRSVDGKIRWSCPRRRFSCATLIVEDDLSAGGHVFPDRRIREISVIQARPAVDGPPGNLPRRSHRYMTKTEIRSASGRERGCQSV